MICCKCGDCCTRFEISSIGKEAGERCFNLDENNNCMIYENRPEECKAHSYPQAVCPIGVEDKGMPIRKCMNCGNGIYEVNADFCSDRCRFDYFNFLNKDRLSKINQ